MVSIGKLFLCDKSILLFEVLVEDAPVVTAITLTTTIS